MESKSKEVRFGLLVFGLAGIAVTWGIWWIYNVIHPPRLGAEMGPMQSLVAYLLLAAANLIFLMVSLVGLVLTIFDLFRK